MIDIDSLPVKHWAKTILIDNEIVDEIAYLKNIKMVYPKRVIKFDEGLIIRKVSVFTANEGTQAVEFYADMHYNGETYTQRFRIYSPHFPRVKKLRQYVGSKIVGANLICTSDSTSSQFHVARYIQIIKRDGLKSNPITRLEPTSANLTYKNAIECIEDYERGQILNKLTFKKLFFNDRKDNDIFV